MVVNTKLFGEVTVSDDKIITFAQGIIGFEDLKKFTILYDIDLKNKHSVSWLQSLDEPSLAFPVINPYLIKEDYKPEIDDELIATLGPISELDLTVLVTISVPKDISLMSCNIKAPIVINSDTKCGGQFIAQNQDYPVKYYIYDRLKEKQLVKGEEAEC